MRGRIGAGVLATLAGLVLLAVLAPRGVLPASLRAPSIAGRIAYVIGGNIWIWQGGPHQVTKTGHDASAVLSADGGRLAYVRNDDSFSDILTQASTGGDPTFLTDNRPSAETGSYQYVQQAVWALMPAWAPDGSRLAYVSDLGFDAPVLWIMAPDGENPHSLTTSPPNPPLEHPRWSPDGSAIAGTSMGSGKDEIWSLDLNSGVWNEVAAPADGAYDPAWSPDGAWIAWAQRTGKQTDIWIGPPDRSTPPVQLTQLGRARAPAFSPDGKQLAFVAELGGVFQIYIVDLTVASTGVTAGTPQQLTDGAGVDAASGISWSR